MKKNEPIIKKYFEVRLECMLPATLTYKVLAENPEKAVDMIKHIQPTSIEYKLIGRKEIKIIVYQAGCTIILFIKHLFGR